MRKASTDGIRWRSRGGEVRLRRRRAAGRGGGGKPLGLCCCCGAKKGKSEHEGGSNGLAGQVKARSGLRGPPVPPVRRRQRAAVTRSRSSARGRASTGACGSGREAELSGPGGFGQWAEWEAQAHYQRKLIFHFLFSKNSPQL
jgi:hypothetical protein